MFSIQVRCNVKVIKRLYNVQNSKKTIELSNMAEQALKLHMKSKKYFENAETMQFFLIQRRKQMETMKYLPSICQTRHKFKKTKTEETQQLTLSFVSKSSSLKKKADILFTLKSIVSNW